MHWNRVLYLLRTVCEKWSALADCHVQHITVLLWKFTGSNPQIKQYPLLCYYCAHIHQWNCHLRKQTTYLQIKIWTASTSQNECTWWSVNCIRPSYCIHQIYSSPLAHTSLYSHPPNTYLKSWYLHKNKPYPG
jgi:hypothetical protein